MAVKRFYYFDSDLGRAIFLTVTPSRCHTLFYLFMLPVAKLIITLFASVFFDGIGSGVIRIIIIGVLHKYNLALTAAGYSKNTLN